MDERNFINALSRAQQLIHDPNFNRQVEKRAAGEAAMHKRGGGAAAGSAEIANLDAMVFGLGTSTPPPQRQPQRRMVAEQQYYDDYEPIQQIQPQPRDLSNSRLPKEIIESFTENPTPEGYFESSVGKMEGLDALMGAGQRTQVNETVRQPQRPAPQAQPQYYPQGGGAIDYEYIKYLIKEAVKECMGTLNESANLNGMRGMCIGEGNVIQFLDKKGNVYEGKLSLKKKGKN